MAINITVLWLEATRTFSQSGYFVQCCSFHCERPILNHRTPTTGKITHLIIAFAPDLQRASFHGVAALSYHTSTTEPLSLLILVKGSYPALGASLRCGKVIFSRGAEVAPLVYAAWHANRYIPINDDDLVTVSSEIAFRPSVVGYLYNILKTFVTETGVVVSLDVAQIAKCPVQDLSYCFLLSQGVFLD